MTDVQRRVLGVGGGVAAILVLVLLFTGVGTGGGEDDRLAVRGRAEHAPSTSSAPTTEAPVDTTLPLLPVTTGVPVPNAVEAPPPTAPPSATPAAPRTAGGSGLVGPSTASATVVDGKGAVLTRPASAATRPVDKAKGCNSANDPGWNVETCGALRSSGTVLLWVVETKGKATRVLVLKEQTAGNWSTVLGAADDAGTAWSSVGVRGEDVSGDGQPELVVGFHRQGADRVVSLDVVDAATAGVVVHRDLTRGVVQTAKGRVSTWSAAGDGYDEVVIQFSGGAWRASAPKRVDRSAVPAPSV